jgi:hypothetical protein
MPPRREVPPELRLPKRPIRTDSQETTKAPDVSRAYADRCDSRRVRAKKSSGEDRTRTLAKNAGETASAVQDGADYGALSAETAELDAELQAIIDAWPSLPDDVKAGIVAMVRAAGG